MPLKNDLSHLPTVASVSCSVIYLPIATPGFPNAKTLKNIPKNIDIKIALPAPLARAARLNTAITTNRRMMNQKMFTSTNTSQLVGEWVATCLQCGSADVLMKLPSTLL